MMLDLTNKVLCNNGTYDITNGAVAPCSSAGGVKGQQTIDWTKLGGTIDYDGWAKNYFSKVSITPVLCKDGTIQKQLNDPSAKVMDACRNNGGRAENQIAVEPQTKKVNLSTSSLSPEEKFYQSLGIVSKGGWSPTVKAKGRFLVAVVLVAGYFAYKKFKK